MKIKELTHVNNPHSIHGIYPYRGKISAIDASATIGQLKGSLTILDPFCGSGTIVYEAVAAGHTGIGTDMNPLAVLISKGKVGIDKPLSSYLTEFSDLKKSIPKSINIEKIAARHFHEDSFYEIMQFAHQIDKMSDYLKACFVGAISLTARGCNDYKWTSSSVGKDIVPKRYISFEQKFLHKIKKHYYPVDSSKGKVDLHDARALSDVIEPESIDVVFSSPPYFDCLDYTAYYGRIIFSILGWDHLEVKNDLIQSLKILISIKTIISDREKCFFGHNTEQ
jgi:adenine-specific DNA methylase